MSGTRPTSWESMFRSILFEGTDPPALASEPPDHFRDLNLDQVVDAVTAGRDEYELRPFFYTHLRSADTVAYRHAVFRDLADDEVSQAVTEFAERMRAMRADLSRAHARGYRYEQEEWFLTAIERYCDAVRSLGSDLSATALRSDGLRRFREHLDGYVHSEGFAELTDDAEQVRRGLAGVRYTMNIRGGRVTVSRFESEPDYSAEIEETFAKFRLGDVKSYRSRFPAATQMNHVEANVVALVARLFPEEFAALDSLRERHGDYIDHIVAAFDREIQFYVAWLEYVARLRRMGLQVCYPNVSADTKSESVEAAFDIALANKRLTKGGSVVTNRFHLDEPERIIVVSGPNQGGKTTFARMFGQLHHLAALGCPVPAETAQVYLCDELLTHFEREEDVSTLSGKLEDDLMRVHDILERATESSVVVMNESFSSTTLRDALVLGTAVLEQIIDRDLLCVYVTFVDELASLSDTTVSMVSAVVPDDPATRTYKIDRRPADGLAYAAAIANKYGLTYDRVMQRLDR